MICICAKCQEKRNPKTYCEKCGSKFCAVHSGSSNCPICKGIHTIKREK